ncbi:MAG: sigma-54-dependent Fis family transcriptional regulator [Deltaproteobacteria bacterium]|nr:sigma-54-dependent Fis family transcriptional regulator [Deltaproteobacteria bacterium]
MAASGTVDARPASRVLIVDDEEGMRHMLSVLLAKNGFEVEDAANGVLALERLKQGGVDIVLSDVRMPELDGLGMLKKLSQAKLPVTVIMMSAFADLEGAVEALKHGAADYVSKPFKPDEILLKIRMAEERNRLTEERERLRLENAKLKGVSRERDAPAGIVGKSQRMHDIFATIAKIADYKSTVLLIGESGTGKELVARALHDLSVRAKGPFIPINCGAIPVTLLESELFGHVKGAFTDANRNKKGLIEEAHTGTLFLDEIGELPVLLQVKLLRFLQEEEIRKVGDNKAIHVDVRVVAATARDLVTMVRDGTFREDLYYRLNVLQLRIPPLRERKDDIPLLVDHFVAKYGARLSRETMTVSKDALRVLMDHGWPGNVRELENTIERAMVLADSERIEVDNLPEKLREERAAVPIPILGDDLSIKKATLTIERELIRRALEKTGGNRTRAAELLEISHRALLYKIKEYGLS